MRMGNDRQWPQPRGGGAPGGAPMSHRGGFLGAPVQVLPLRSPLCFPQGRTLVGEAVEEGDGLLVTPR
jgi:hypothetical protein